MQDVCSYVSKHVTRSRQVLKKFAMKGIDGKTVVRTHGETAIKYAVGIFDKDLLRQLDRIFERLRTDVLCFTLFVFLCVLWVCPRNF